MIKIAYVEDEPRNVFTFEQYAMLLRGRGVDNKLTVYRSGEEALQQIPTCIPDIVFIDLSLPGISGLALANQLRQHPKLAQSANVLPIVSLVAYSAPVDQRTVAEAGCNELLVKPVRYQSVEDIIRRYFPNLPQPVKSTLIP